MAATGLQTACLVQRLHQDLGSREKLFVDLACTSRNAWERNRGLPSRASLEWLTSGAVNGERSGVVKLGY